MNVNTPPGIKGNSPVAAKFAIRFIALADLCPEGKLLKASDGPRRVECKRKKGITDLTLKILLRDFSMGQPILHVTARIASSTEGAAVSLYDVAGRTPSEFITRRDEKYLSAMLTWAEGALPTAPPVQATSKVEAWTKDYTHLFAILTGCSFATARKRLNTNYFANQEENSISERLDALLTLMREEGSILFFDWKEDERRGLIEDTANRRKAKKSEACNLGDNLSPTEWLEQFRLFLDRQGQSLVAIESAMDADIIAIVARSKLEELTRLLRLLDLQLSIDVDPQAI